ncbi:MAG: hypothetical protein WC807_04215 [Hyphomicrobium sp.]
MIEVKGLRIELPREGLDIRGLEPRLSGQETLAERKILEVEQPTWQLRRAGHVRPSFSF